MGLSAKTDRRRVPRPPHKITASISVLRINNGFDPLTKKIYDNQASVLYRMGRIGMQTRLAPKTRQMDGKFNALIMIKNLLTNNERLFG